MAILTPLSKLLASAAVWNVSPNFLLPVFQWWKVGITLLYSKSRLIVQLKTTWKGKDNNIYLQVNVLGNGMNSNFEICHSIFLYRLH